MQHKAEKLVEQIPKWAAAKKHGVDVVMLLDNLGRTIEQRIKRLQIAADTLDEFKSARESK